jgi:hypothetical protein
MNLLLHPAPHLLHLLLRKAHPLEVFLLEPFYLLELPVEPSLLRGHAPQVHLLRQFVNLSAQLVHVIRIRGLLALEKLISTLLLCLRVFIEHGVKL